MFNGTLKPYQIEAVEKMVSQKQILVAYEMGLGKTPMTIAAIEELRDNGEIGAPVLVLCLASLKYQWQKEITKFSDSTALVIDGTPKQRNMSYESYSEYDYIIMNYEQVVNDWDIICAKSFAAVICDEATAIKGFRAKRAKKVKELGKTIPIRFALTGTPVENGRPEEIYSIMQFVDRDVLGRFDLFDKTFIVRNHFGGVQRYRNMELLHSRILESTVRKSQTDDDVRPFLPDATYREPILVKLDARSKNLYNYVAQDLRNRLIEATTLFGSSFNVASHYGQWHDASDPANGMRGELMARITALRQICSSTDLLVESYYKFLQQKGEGSSYAFELGEQGWFDVDVPAKSPKLDACVSYLSDHLEIDPSYKAVVFSSYIGSVNHILDRLVAKGHNAVPYTGKMNAKEKEDNKVLFQTSKDVRVLVSSDAGGYGVDLPQANLLVNFDQPWSAGMSVQRNGRINRASSQWPSITIQDFLVEGSIEQRQYDMLKQKSNIAGAVLDGENINSRGGVDLTVGSLLQFITETLS